MVDVTSAFDDYKLLHQNITADFADVTIAFDDYESNNRFWWCNISVWWQYKINDLGDVTLVYDDNKIWLDFSDVTLVYDDNTR